MVEIRGWLATSLDQERGLAAAVLSPDVYHFLGGVPSLETAASRVPSRQCPAARGECDPAVARVATVTDSGRMVGRGHFRASPGGGGIDCLDHGVEESTFRDVLTPGGAGVSPVPAAVDCRAGRARGLEVLSGGDAAVRMRAVEQDSGLLFAGGRTGADLVETGSRQEAGYHHLDPVVRGEPRHGIDHGDDILLRDAILF